MISRDKLLARTADLLRRTHVEDAEELIAQIGMRLIADAPPVVLRPIRLGEEDCICPGPEEWSSCPVHSPEYTFDAAPNFPIRVPPGEYLALRVEPRKVGFRVTLIGCPTPPTKNNETEEPT